MTPLWRIQGLCLLLRGLLCPHSQGRLHPTHCGLPRGGHWYLFVLSRQFGEGERWLWVHGLVMHIPQRRDEDKVGAGAAWSKHKHKRDQN